MSTKEELQAIIEKQYTNSIIVLRSIPDNLIQYVSHTSSDTVFFSNMSIKQMQEILHGNKYKLSNYYASSNNRLVVVYTVGNCDWAFFLPEECIKEISNNKCRIEISVHTDKLIVCDAP